MFGLVSSDVRDGCKDIAAMGCSTLDAVAVIDAALASLVVDIKVAEVVVKVHGAGTQVAAEQGSVCGEDGGDVDVTLAAQGNADACKPFMEVGNDSGLALVGHKLDRDNNAGQG